MSKKRRQHSPELKAQVGLEALKGIEPVNAIAARHRVHPVQVSQWKKEVAQRLPELFARKANGDLKAMKEREMKLFEEIGRLKMDLEWLKKKLRNWSAEQRRRMIEPTNSNFSMSRQCRLLGLARSSYYHRLKPESTENLALMKAIAKAHTDHPFSGARQMVRFLGDDGWVVIRKRVGRLTVLMSLEAMLSVSAVVDGEPFTIIEGGTARAA